MLKLLQQGTHGGNYPALFRRHKRAQHADLAQIPLARTTPTNPLVHQQQIRLHMVRQSNRFGFSPIRSVGSQRLERFRWNRANLYPVCRFQKRWMVVAMFSLAKLPIDSFRDVERAIHLA
jgi:hypothetical protein